MPKKLSDTPKSVRQQKIYNILRHITSEEHALSATEIHNRLAKEDVETCTRTVKRDLEEMSITHRFLATEGTPARFFCSDEYDPDYQLTFNEGELKTMALALRSLREMADPFQKGLCEKTETILLSKFPKEVAQDFERLRALTIVSPGFHGEAALENSQAYSMVLKALKLGRVIQCQNHSPHKSKEDHARLRTFSPLKLHLVGSELYLMSLDHDDQKIKRLKVCRLHHVTLLEQKIDPKYLEQLDLSGSIGGFGGPEMAKRKYVIHCDELMASLFREKRLHATQKVEELNGAWCISFEAHPSIEIARYLSGWAKHIRHVEPAETLKEMQEIWQAGAELFDKKQAA